MRRAAGILILLGVMAILSLFSWLNLGFVGLPMRPYMCCGWWGWPLSWMPLGFILFWALVALAAYLIIMGSNPSRAMVDRALEIARERYAKGEITSEEYEEIKRRLTQRGEE